MRRIHLRKIEIRRPVTRYYTPAKIDNKYNDDGDDGGRCGQPVGTIVHRWRPRQKLETVAGSEETSAPDKRTYEKMSGKVKL